jgi:hypothetical protein
MVFRGRSSIRRVSSLVAVCAAPLLLARCNLNNILDVPIADQIIADSLDDPARAAFLVNSMVGTFICAQGAYIVATGEITDVLGNLSTNVARAQYDRRALKTGVGVTGPYGTAACDQDIGFGVYRPVQEARYYADFLLKKLDTWTDAQVGPSRTALIATAAAYGGYAHILLGEGFCSAAIDGGPEITPQEVFQRGEKLFDRAIASAQAAGLSDILGMAYVGRARTRLDRGNLPGAAADAALVPPGFVKGAQTSASTPYANNKIFRQINGLQASTVEPYFRNLTWQGVTDPRTAVTRVLSPVEYWAPNKYSALDTPVPIARYEEAVLIQAEAALSAGSLTQAVAFINLLHSRVGLPPYSSTNAQDILNQIIEERSRELFLEGQRLYDIIRFSIPLRPTTGTAYRGAGGGGLYEDTTCMPLPPSEYQNNPNIHR